MLKKLFAIAALFRLCSAQNASAPTIDLGYARYQGKYDAALDLNVYNGIRYAAPPVGKLRWQPPQAPAENGSQIIPAVDYAPQCPQTPPGSGPTQASPSGNEDCLFLNVQAPTNKQNLPVMVFIHGGGYGQGSAHIVDFAQQIRTNGNAYIVVSIQYRLGAFGFLSSAELARSAVPNAGIHDMRFALQWVQKYIHLFGGDPEQVTVAGESAGGGGVMLLAMANGGADGDSLFNGIIASSPYLPTQWNHDGTQPTESYNRFAERVGCLADDVAANGSTFDCLLSADTVALQNASAEVSAAGHYGQWAFIPVTDGALVQGRPTEQLLKGGEINGIRVLVGNNANEAVFFVPLNVTSEDTFVDWLQTTYPLLNEDNITSILELYSVPAASSDVLINSDGQRAPFSTTNSGWASGWQQAAFNLYSETTFVCPSYWLADAYAAKENKNAWHYQFSVPPSPHASDIGPLSSSPEIIGTGMNKAFRASFQQIWGNFVVGGNPTLGPAETLSLGGDNIIAAGTDAWPEWKGASGADWMLSLNMTGGVPVTLPQALTDGTKVNVTSYVPGNDSAPPLEAAFKIVEGAAWEDGRGKRCQLWADLGPWIME
ncbi:alpha/beta-hydrolase [Xylariaceae sp. FL0662B]|nr:alpha/beta-hydrolase [Xylariaceae sp. FL0662B]